VQIVTARDVAIHAIAYAGCHKGDERQAELALDHQPNGDRHQQDAEDRDNVGDADGHDLTRLNDPGLADLR
jgi:hypothetical protein